MENPLCIALDATEPEACLELARATHAHAGMFKIGLAGFAAGGPRLVTDVARLRPVFLDLKGHDIPAQVAGAVKSAVRLGVAYVTVHASGGADMVRAACGAAGDRLNVLAVTVLTSLDGAALRSVGVAGQLEDQVTRLARLAVAAGASGVVCSPLELPRLRAELGARSEGGPLLVTPGIRAEGEGAHDQRRAASVRSALAAGADVVVVGRPISGDPDPRKAARRLQAEALAFRGSGVEHASPPNPQGK